jgi:hypothetical protein
MEGCLSSVASVFLCKLSCDMACAVQLRNYERSMAAVLCGQLHGKRLHGGLMVTLFVDRLGGTLAVGLVVASWEGKDSH